MPDDPKPPTDQAGGDPKKPAADPKPPTDQAGGEKAAAISEKLAAELQRRARLAGASENSLDELKGALDKATTDEVPRFEEQIAKLRKKNRKTYHVVSAGAVMHEGERYESGENLLLTEQEAAELGAEIVAPGSAPPPPLDVAKRKAGKYVVREERNVCSGGRFHGPGAVLELTQDDARSLGDFVEEA